MALITKRRLNLAIGGVGLGGYFTFGDDLIGQSTPQENDQFRFEGNLIELTGEGDYFDTIEIENLGVSILIF